MKTKDLILTTIIFVYFNVITQSTMLISSPAINPFDQSKIPYSYANIGTIPYGKTLTFDLKQLPDLNLCESMQNITHLTQPTYLIVDSSVGTCSFTTQAINAQFLGAKGVVFVSQMVNYYNKVVQVDDGNGRKVHITVLFISPNVYRQLTTVKNIHIKVQYEVYKTDKVNLTYFLTASGRTNYILLRQFRPYLQKLQSYINFKPLYLTLRCSFCDQNDCLINKDYCMFQMDQFQDGRGQYILQEQLRQWMVWKNYGTISFLNYLNQFDKFCTSNWMDSKNCGSDLLKKLKIDQSTVVLKQSPSAIMDQWRIQETSAGFILTPQITINQQLYAGTYDPEDMFDAICDNLLNPPEVCQETSDKPASSKFGWIIGAIIIACVLSLVIGIFLYKKCIKQQLTKDMFSKVNELVARYATKVSEHNKKRKDKIKMRLTEEL